MSFPETIDFDKVADHALTDAGTAMRNWIKGTPRSEEAFMNQLTGELARGRRGCDVGVRQRVDMTVQQYMLHRQGSSQTDKFGADLAVTIVIRNLPNESGPYVKTALFQLKKSEGYRVKVKKNQLDDAAEDIRIYDRSYVLATDEVRQGYRLHEIDSLRIEFDPGSESDDPTKTFKGWKWTCLTNWINDWFSCDEGPESDPEDPDSIESLLEEFIVEDDVNSAWASRDDDSPLDFPEDLIPAKTWLIFEFEKVEEK